MDAAALRLDLAARHLRVHDPAARGHPLHVARAHLAPIAEAVAMFDAAAQDVRDRLDAAVRMPRESREIILRVLVTEIV